MNLLLAIIIAVLSSKPEPVIIAELTSLPHRFVNRLVRVCGDGELADGGKKSRFLINRNSIETLAIFVSPDHSDFKVQPELCLTGIFRRVDGLSAAEIRRRGWGTRVVDGANPDYALYPAE